VPDDIQKDPRTYFAAERTLLAWIRTGLALMGFGFVVARFGLFLRELQSTQGIPVPQSPGISLWLGTALVFIGVVVNVVAALQHTRLIRRLRQGTWTPEHSSPLALVLAVVLAVIGAGVVIYLLVG
jgi:putative membrane protein